MKIRYIKVLRDLTSDYAKNLMLVLAIAIGVVGIGSILGAYAVIKLEMTRNYMGTVPASATIELDGNIEQSLVDSVKKLPGISEADRRATVLARINVRGKWYPLLLFVVDDFKHLRTNKFNHLSGAFYPTEGTMLAERTAFGVMKAVEGDEITIKTVHGSPKLIRITGTVHDPGLAPAWQEQAGYGYITLSTLHWLGETGGFDQLRILVSEPRNSVPHITKKAEEVATWLKQKGYTIHEIQIPPPNRHPHQGQVDTVMSIFIVFSFMILILGSILVATSMATLMVKQIRQIGVMKTIGATSTQIAGLYLFMMVILCAIALIIGIPISQLAAFILYKQLSVLLNIDLTDSSIPNWVPLLQISTVIIIPLLAAALPVIRGSRLSVRKAMDNYGVSSKNQGSTSWSSRLGQGLFLGETFTLSLRNVFRQRSRLIMTLGLLAAGGAMFMTALNVSEAWDTNLKRIYTQRLYDLDIKLTNPIQADTLLANVKHMTGVTIVEGWSYSSTFFGKDAPNKITHTYPDKGHGSFTMQALPVPTKLLNPTVLKGIWLRDHDANEVVLNQSARALSPGISIGDSVSLSVNGTLAQWNVIGFTEDVGSPATAYVSFAAFTKYTTTPGRVNMLRIAFADRSKTYVSKKTRAVETLLDNEHISVSASVPVWLLQNAIAAHMRILVNSLLAMAILMAIVGTLGLMSTMSMNVMERTREIGVMRAIGATPEKIRNLIVWEGLTIGALSILAAFILSLFLSTYLGHLIGNLAFRTPLTLTISWLAFAIWVGIVVIGSYMATIYPARRANRITTREALAYE